MYKIYLNSTLIYKPGSSNEAVQLLDAKLTEELNKAAVFTFRMPPTNAGYSSIVPLSSTITIYDDSEIIFIGRPVSIESDFNKIKTVTCEDPIAWLNDGILRPYEATSLQDLMDYISGYKYSQDHTKPAGYNTQASSSRQIYFPRSYTGSNTYSSDEYQTFKDILIDTVLPDIGDYAWMQLTYGAVGNANVSLTVTNTVPSCNQTIRFGKNLLDLNNYIDPTDLYTIVIPLGKDIDTGETDPDTGIAITKPLTIKSVNSGVDYLINSGAASSYGNIEVVLRYPDIEDASELKQIAQKDLNEHIALTSRIEINAVDLARVGVSVNKLKCGYNCTLVSPHGLNGTYRCTKVVRNLMNPAKSKYTLGVTAKMYTQKSLTTQALIARSAAIAAQEASIAKATAAAAKTIAEEANEPITDEELDEVLV